MVVSKSLSNFVNKWVLRETENRLSRLQLMISSPQANINQNIIEAPRP